MNTPPRRRTAGSPRRVLLVTSSYAPAMVADMHRVRHLAWELPRCGWECEVLAPDASFQRSQHLEPDSQSLFASAAPHHAVPPQAAWLFRALQVRSIGWRAWWPMARAGAALLRQRHFDLVYLSTANFNLFCLGRTWARQFGVPYVLDYHDPWVRDRVDYRTSRHPWKLWVNSRIARFLERRTLADAAGVVAVSPFYLDELRHRYGVLPALRPDRCEAIPFAGCEVDFPGSPPAAGGAGGPLDIVYVGAGGAIMAKSFTTICATLAQLATEQPQLLAGIKFRLLGTHGDWRPGDPKPLEAIAARLGLAGVVEEAPQRVSYQHASELMKRSAGLLVLGVDDVAYMPSKLFNFALAGKPLLGCFVAGSPPAVFFSQLPGLGHLLTFAADAAAGAPASVPAAAGFLAEVQARRQFDRRALLAPHLAPAMARRHAALFTRICDSSLTT